MHEGQRLLNCMLAIQVPVIAAINGPVLDAPRGAGPGRHRARLGDRDLLRFAALRLRNRARRRRAHRVDAPPWPEPRAVLPAHRPGTLNAQQAQDYGVVAEVLPPDQLLARARELAAVVASKPTIARRYARRVCTREWKRLLEATSASASSTRPSPLSTSPTSSTEPARAFAGPESARSRRFAWAGTPGEPPGGAPPQSRGGAPHFSSGAIGATLVVAVPEHLQTNDCSLPKWNRFNDSRDRAGDLRKQRHLPPT